MNKLFATALAAALAVPLLVSGAQAAPHGFGSKMPKGPHGFTSKMPKGPHGFGFNWRNGPPHFVDAPLPLAGGLPALAVMAGAVFMARQKRKNG